MIFFRKDIIQEIDGRMFAFVMSDISEQQPAIGLEEVVVFQVSGQIRVCPDTDGPSDQKGTGATAECEGLDRPARQTAVSKNG